MISEPDRWQRFEQDIAVKLRRAGKAEPVAYREAAQVVEQAKILAAETEAAKLAAAAAKMAARASRRSIWPRGEGEVKRLLAIQPMTVAELTAALGTAPQRRVRALVDNLQGRGILTRAGTLVALRGKQ